MVTWWNSVSGLIAVAGTVLLAVSALPTVDRNVAHDNVGQGSLFGKIEQKGDNDRKTSIKEYSSLWVTNKSENVKSDHGATIPKGVSGKEDGKKITNKLLSGNNSRSISEIMDYNTLQINKSNRSSRVEKDVDDPLDFVDYEEQDRAASNLAPKLNDSSEYYEGSYADELDGENSTDVQRRSNGTGPEAKELADMDIFDTDQYETGDVKPGNDYGDDFEVVERIVKPRSLSRKRKKPAKKRRKPKQSRSPVESSSRFKSRRSRAKSAEEISSRQQYDDNDYNYNMIHQRRPRMRTSELNDQKHQSRFYQSGYTNTPFNYHQLDYGYNRIPGSNILPIDHGEPMSDIYRSSSAMTGIGNYYHHASVEPQQASPFLINRVPLSSLLTSQYDVNNAIMAGYESNIEASQSQIPTLRESIYDPEPRRLPAEYPVYGANPPIISQYATYQQQYASAVPNVFETSVPVLQHSTAYVPQQDGFQAPVISEQQYQLAPNAPVISEKQYQWVPNAPVISEKPYPLAPVTDQQPLQYHYYPQQFEYSVQHQPAYITNFVPQQYYLRQ